MGFLKLGLGMGDSILHFHQKVLCLRHHSIGSEVQGGVGVLTVCEVEWGVTGAWVDGVIDGVLG